MAEIGILGAIKWFNQARGYGFITRLESDLENKDVFAHAADFKKSNIDDKDVDEGQKYRFDVVETPRGLKAANIVRVTD